MRQGGKRSIQRLPLFHAQEPDVNEERMLERGRAQGKRKVSELMRNLNSDAASVDVHIWSPAPVSVVADYHKIWGPVKGGRVVPRLEGKHETTIIFGKM